MDQKYRIYQSDDFPALRRYKPRVYNMVYEDTIASDDPSGEKTAPDGLLNRLFDIHNQDSRPARTKIRSMSVSDMVGLLDKDGNESFYIVESIGFSLVDNGRLNKNKDGSVTLFPEGGINGLYLYFQSYSRPDSSGPVTRPVEIPIWLITDMLVEANYLADLDKSDRSGNRGYQTPKLLLRHDGVELTVSPTHPDETEFPGMNIDAMDANGEPIYLANVELPNTEWPNAITARLYNGYGRFESDEPSAIMVTSLQSKEDLDQLEAYTEDTKTYRKIVYVDKEICCSRSWSKMPKQEDFKFEDEHDSEAPAVYDLVQTNGSDGEKSGMGHVRADRKLSEKELEDLQQLLENAKDAAAAGHIQPGCILPDSIAHDAVKRFNDSHSVKLRFVSFPAVTKIEF